MGDYKWIGLVRKFYNCSFYNDSNAVQMFLHIFLNAQREDKPYFDQITMRGQFRTSIKDIMQFLRISRKAARRSLDKLKAAGVIHVASLRRNGVLITVREFSKFLALENVRGGWVKLYYDLDFQYFFEDAQVLHIYLHILLHTYSDNDTYEDSFWFDFKKISAQTGISFEGIKSSLLKLRKTGILNVGYNGQKRLSSVRLIDFSDYIRNTLPATSPSPSIEYVTPTESLSETDIFFSDTDFVLSEEKGIKTGQKELKGGPKGFQKDSLRNSHDTPSEDFANNYNSTVYNDIGKKEGQKKEQNSSKVRAAKTPPSKQGDNYAREHINKENRDKRIENFHYNDYSPVRNFSSIEELVLDDEWTCSMQELYGFAGKDALYTALTLFLANLKCRKEDVPKDLRNFLDYFCNWYKRNEKKLLPKLKQHASPNDYGRNLWDKCMAAFARIVNDQTFVSVFKPLVFESFDTAARTLTIRLPNHHLYHTLEDNYVDTLKVVLGKFFGGGMKLQYRFVGG
uniref:DnaA N-terminal domain-containing protein n=1 Tax=Prevotella sp. GTC17254 TaxID=3236794 RepID=A0AB33IWZ8_9BACT